MSIPTLVHGNHSSAKSMKISPGKPFMLPPTRSLDGIQFPEIFEHLDYLSGELSVKSYVLTGLEAAIHLVYLDLLFFDAERGAQTLKQKQWTISLRSHVCYGSRWIRISRVWKR